jgi:hypothetical protein
MQREELELQHRERLQAELAERDRKHKEACLQKELQVNNLERRIIELEARQAKDADDLGVLQRQLRETETRLKEASRAAEEARAGAIEQAERTRREFEVSESRYRQAHLLEKEVMVREYEAVVLRVREEYQLCNDTLRRASESQVAEITAVNGRLREHEERHRKERGELEEQLVKDKYTLDLLQNENRQLQEAKLLTEQEKEQLYK